MCDENTVLPRINYTFSSTKMLVRKSWDCMTLVGRRRKESKYVVEQGISRYDIWIIQNASNAVFVKSIWKSNRRQVPQSKTGLSKSRMVCKLWSLSWDGLVIYSILCVREWRWHNLIFNKSLLECAFKFTSATKASAQRVNKRRFISILESNKILDLKSSNILCTV